MMIRGSVDVVTSTEMRGWAYCPGEHGSVRVQAVLDHEVVGEAIADMLRPDLAAAGLGDGKSGYQIKLFRPIDPLYLPFLTVKIEDGDVELPRMPTLGLREFFGELYRRHPSAGRQRSVLGGLWTDRTDAAAVLLGKTRIGQVPRDASGPLSELINNGLAVLTLASPPAAPAWKKALPERVADLLEDPGVLAVMRAALEDDPLALRASWLGVEAAPLAQASTGNPAPSPAECLELVVAFGDGVVLDLVRDSHRLPEFTPGGVSRWLSGDVAAALEIAGANGLMDRHALPGGSVAVVGPGLIWCARAEAGSAAVRILCVPRRQTPLAMAAETGMKDVTRPSGVRVIL